jgi:hypothetical protein
MFIPIIKMIHLIKKFSLPFIFLALLTEYTGAQNGTKIFRDPPREFSVMPFWFWNDTLKDEEIVRQISDFEAHGVYGFVIHPRIGLPEDTGWLSPKMIHAMHVAIGEAARRKMYVILYDEGMYPSGSSSGQVVARNPAHAARGLAKIDLKPGESFRPVENMKLVTINERPGGDRVAIVDLPSGGVIRGLRYIGEGTKQIREELPPAGDILNPEAVASFMELVYERFNKEFGSYFGNTILGIFTDEPNPLGRGSGKGILPGNASILNQVNKFLGYDFKPFLSDLWYNDNPDSEKHRKDYFNAINRCLEENYFKRLGDWCSEHGIALMGHPSGSMDIGAERYFGVPGQDLVWRYIEPGQKALEGEHSTMAKCASSAMIHLGRQRNSNELYGAYGHNLSYEELLWLANWCFIRGHNLLFPHAFYYSVRGPRLDERPPDVGPNSPWWEKYKPYADACRRLSWLNTGSEHICQIAILGNSTWLPDRAAKALFQNQLDFNYIETRHLWEDVKADKDGIHIAGMNYRVLIIDSLLFLDGKAIPVLKEMEKNGRLILYENSGFSGIFKNATLIKSSADLVKATREIIVPDLILSPSSENIRCRHIIKGAYHYYLLFNEVNTPVTTKINVPVKGKCVWLEPSGAKETEASLKKTVNFNPWELKILRIKDN